jgi:hypothetical protein
MIGYYIISFFYCGYIKKNCKIVANIRAFQVFKIAILAL